MFTGIITAIGRVVAARGLDGGCELEVESGYPDLSPGESIAVDGACLTVERVTARGFTVHAIRTTLDRTLFAEYAPGRRVNLERALRVGDRLGGHFVQGHVDGVGRVRRVEDRADARLLELDVPPVVAEISVPLGAITVDGVNLTVNAIPSSGVIQVALVPFTLQHTTLSERRPGDRAHLEGDALGRYVRALCRGRDGVSPEP